MTVIYTYARHEEEAELCQLELSCLFGSSQVSEGYVLVEQADELIGQINVDSSPFMKRRIEVIASATTMEELGQIVSQIKLADQSFKVLHTEGDTYIDYAERRQLERIIGSQIQGKADMHKPDILFGLTFIKGIWYFGYCTESNAVWLRNSKKPQNYSTALPVRAARALVNIAACTAIQSEGLTRAELRLIDPCCGMGTVLIEALSMDFTIQGMDKNPLAVKGARINLGHFGYNEHVMLGDMRELQECYHAAIVDLPYNHCSVLSEDVQQEMLQAVRRIANCAVIISTIPLDSILLKTGFLMQRQAILKKASFIRYITVVK